MTTNILDRLLLNQTSNVEKTYRIIYILSALILTIWVFAYSIFFHQDVSNFRQYLLIFTTIAFVNDGTLMPHSFITEDNMRLIRYHNIKTASFYDYFLRKTFSLKNVFTYIVVILVISMIGNFVTNLSFLDYLGILLIGLVLAVGFTALNSLVFIKNMKMNMNRALLLAYNLIIFVAAIVFIEYNNHWLFIPIAATYSTIVVLICYKLSKRIEVLDL